MKFKEYITERIDFGAEIKDLILDYKIPISPKMMYNLGYSDDEEIVAYHMTNAQDLKTLTELNSKSQISCFTEPSLELTKLPSNPNVLVKIKGRLLIESKTDLYTYLDYNGRRWIKLDSSKNKLSPGSKLKFQIQGITKSLLKQNLSNINLYKNYIKEVQELLENGGYKLLNQHLTSITKDSLKYNELVLDKVKILGAWSFNTDKEQEIKKLKIKYLGTLTAKELMQIKEK